MVIKTSLYVMQYSGELFQLDLEKHTSTRISNHGFDSGIPTVRPSFDGRWISYSGVQQKKGKTQYWLFDRKTKTDRLVFEHPAWGGGMPSFSPDGRYLSIDANYDTRWGNTSGAGMYLFDTATSSMVSVKLPTAIDQRVLWGSTNWSKDGRELLIQIRAMNTSNSSEYYSYRPATKRIEKITGFYNSAMHEHVFTRRSKEISLFGEVLPRSSPGSTSERSPDGKWHALLSEEKADGSYSLNIVSKNGEVKAVAIGGSENCIGKTVYIIGWLDDRHLVYRSRGVDYLVFDVVTGATADLFVEKDGPTEFTW